MIIETRQSGGTTILQPTGKITMGVGDIALREAVYQAVEGGARKILVNLGQVTTIDSSGIGELVSSYSMVANRAGRLKLCQVPPKIQDILTITRLVTVFDVYDHEDEAVRSFDS